MKQEKIRKSVQGSHVNSCLRDLLTVHFIFICCWLLVMRGAICEILNIESGSKNIDSGFGIYPKCTWTYFSLNFRKQVTIREMKSGTLTKSLLFSFLLFLFSIRSEFNLENVHIKKLCVYNICKCSQRTIETLWV